MSLENVLAHYGVKGMRWGVRRRSGPSAGTTQITEVTTKRGRVKLSARSGPARTAHPDAVRAAVTKSRVKKSGTHSVSNDDLQALIKRMNLEKQYAELSQRDKRKVVGAKFVGDVLTGVAKGQATRLGNELATEQINKLLKNAGKK